MSSQEEKNARSEKDQVATEDMLSPESDAAHSAEQTGNSASENTTVEGGMEDLLDSGEHAADESSSLLRELEQELQESRDKHLRLLAEFDNFKRRNAKERLELRKTAAEDLIVDLLGVLDDFQRAKSALENNPEASKAAEGFLLISGKLRHILDQRELKPMEAKGADFDPERHEAITEIPAPSDEMKGKVVDVIEEGYLLGDKIIRYAKVVVGK